MLALNVGENTQHEKVKPVRRDRSYNLEPVEVEEDEALLERLRIPPPEVEEEADDDDLDLEISDESFMEVLNTSPDLVDAIIDLIEESNREVAMIINPNLPQLDEDNDFTADEKTQMEENI